MKKQNSYIENIFFHAKEIIKLEQGLTNDNYYVLTKQNEEIVIRLTKEENQHLFHRDVEETIIKQLAPYAIDVPCLYFDKDSGDKVTKYLPNATHKERYTIEELKQVALLLHTFHHLSITCPIEFDPIKKQKQYYQNIKNPPLALHQFEDLEKRFYEYYVHSEKVLCHNDVVKGNLLFTPNRLYLIDYEYAANNDIMFDLASFISENNIDDETQQRIFLQAYFKETWKESFIPYFKTYLAYEDYLWSTWAYMRYEQTNVNAFLDIYQQKLTRLKKSL